VFESKSCITLNVMIVNPEEGHSPHFDVSLSLPGVGKPNPGASLWGQFAGRFLPIFASSGFVAVTFLCIRSFRELKSTRQNGIGLWAMALAAFTSYIIGCIFLVLFVSMFFGGVAAAIFLTPSWYESAVARFG
jgi:hypothetical protein